jgi:hypothetical protein
VISKFDIEEAEKREEDILTPKGADAKQLQAYMKEESKK